MTFFLSNSSLLALRLEGGGPPGLPPGYAYDCDVIILKNLTYDKTEKKKIIMTKIGITARKIRKFFVKFSVAIMDVDFSACFYVIILEKKRAMRLPSPPKKVSITSL